MYSNQLYHHGILGMKWGVRKKYQSVTRSLGSSRFAKSAISKTKSSVTPEQKNARRKKVLKVGAAVVGTALAVYGAYKFNRYVKNKNIQAAAEVTKRAMSKTVPNVIKTEIPGAAKAVASNTAKIVTSNVARTSAFSAAKTTVSKAANTTVKSIIASQSGYNYENLLKANNDLLKKSMDDILNGL